MILCRADLIMDPNLLNSISGLADAGGPQQDSAQPAAPSPAAAQPAQQPQQPQPTSQQPAPSGPQPGQPHAGLRNILQSLFEGMDAFATSAATGGEKGGVQEVEQFNQARKELALKQQQSQRDTATANAQIQHLQALTNAQTAQLSMMQLKLPLEIQKMQSDVFSSEINAMKEAGFSPSEIAMIEGQSTQEHLAGVSKAANGDFVNNAAIPVHSDNGIGKGGTTFVTPFQRLQSVTLDGDKLTTMLRPLQLQVDSAVAKGLGDKPEIKAAQGVLDSISKQAASGGSMNLADFHNVALRVMTPVSQVVTQQQDITKFQKDRADALKAKNDADPLFKLENDPAQMSGEKSSAAIPLLQSKLTDPGTAPADKVRASRLLAVAQSAHARYLSDQVQKANAEQQAKQGDPKAAGALLASGDLTLTDMKTRGMTPKFITETIAAAKTIDPKYNPADEMAAENVAKSPTQVQFFGSANSLIAKGGTLDQVVEAGAKLPNHTFPVFNKLADVQSYASGHPEVAAYMQTALGAADDYGKVLGGGTGTEGMQMHILNAMNASLNQGQRTSVVNAMKKAVNSQVTERIGTNKFLMRRYGYALPQNQTQQKYDFSNPDNFPKAQ
jgi:hypothetical protein